MAVVSFVVSVYVRLAVLLHSLPAGDQYLRLAVWVQHQL